MIFEKEISNGINYSEQKNLNDKLVGVAIVDGEIKKFIEVLFWKSKHVVYCSVFIRKSKILVNFLVLMRKFFN